MTPRPLADTSRALRRIRSLLTEALGSTIASRWATAHLDDGEPNARAELLATLFVAENALHHAAAGLLRLEESGLRHRRRPVEGDS